MCNFTPHSTIPHIYNTKKKLPMSNEALAQRLRVPFMLKLKELMLDESMVEDLTRVYIPLAEMIKIGLATEQMHVIGINGAQGAGKTTFCELMKLTLEEGMGLRVAVIGIDDLYMSRADRQQLAATVHPLFATRGVPGTHYVQLGIDTLEQLAGATGSTVTLLPRFNKATDEPLPRGQWERFTGRPDVVLFEGWCMGAAPQPLGDLIEPVNDLERTEDPDAVWRSYANLQLKTTYARLFDKISLLVMLKVPSFEKVYEWRELQEHKLRMRTKGTDGLRVMSEAEVARFIAHYERLTRWILQEMPGRADVLFPVNTNHRICLD